MQRAHNIAVPTEQAEWEPVYTHDRRLAFYRYVPKIQKGHNDDREYCSIRLNNGLEAVLVHDAKADKAAACMNVAVGFTADPDDIPGLAHFCEHLMFMGSKQFPRENEYKEYLQKHDGQCDAETFYCNTAHYFTVAAGALGGALERFSAFFHSPLFSKSCTMREVGAVDSEYLLYQQRDYWRLREVFYSHVRRGHPLRKFIVGNRKTLLQAARSARLSLRESASSRHHGAQHNSMKSSHTSSQHKELPKVQDEEAGMEARNRLMEWWRKEYGAERMRLAVVGRESLKELIHMVMTLFSPIQNRGQNPMPHLPREPFERDQLASITYVKTVTDMDKLTIRFPIPYQAPYWRVKSGVFLGNLMEHEGAGSLDAYLKNKGWISQIRAFSEDIGRGVSYFELDIDLTKDGLNNYREVIRACFKYLNMLRSLHLPKWFYDELSTLKTLDFRFAEKVPATEYAEQIAASMQMQIPRSLVLNGTRLLWGWDEQIVRQTQSMLVVENCLITVSSQDLRVIGKSGPWSKERWYGTEFMTEKLDERLMAAARARNDISDLSLPNRNQFVPSNVEVEKVRVSQSKKHPSLIQRDDLVELWFKKDDQFWTPRAQLIIEERTPEASKTARTTVLTQLFTSLVKDSLTEYSYDATLAGLMYKLEANKRGIFLTVDGYNDKLHVLAEHVLNKMRNPNIRRGRFNVMKEKLQKELRNKLLGDPYFLSDHYLIYLLVDRAFPVEEQLSEIQSIHMEELLAYSKVLLSQLKYKILIDGNLYEKDAKRLVSKMQDIIGARALPAEKIPVDRSRHLHKPCNFVWERYIANADEANSSVSYCCYVGKTSDQRTRVVCSLLNKILEEPVYHVLRTREQLGYIVQATTLESIEFIGWRALIQSDKDPTYVESRIEEFLVHMQSVLEGMHETEFDKYRSAVIHSWKKKLENLDQEVSRFWKQISDGYLDFQRLENDAEFIKTVTKVDVIQMFKKRLLPSSSSRSKLSVHMRPKNPAPPKLSQLAAQKFFAALRRIDYGIDETKYNKLCEDMSIKKARGYWEKTLSEKVAKNHKVKETIAEFDRLVKKYPEVGYSRVELGRNVVFIKDGAKFRQSLTLSDPASPVKDLKNFEPAPLRAQQDVKAGHARSERGSHFGGHR